MPSGIQTSRTLDSAVEQAADEPGTLVFHVTLFSRACCASRKGHPDTCSPQDRPSVMSRWLWRTDHVVGSVAISVHARAPIAAATATQPPGAQGGGADPVWDEGSAERHGGESYAATRS